VRVVDVVGICVAVLIVAFMAAVVARQRYMLNVRGGQPVAVKVRGERWVYGIGRYTGGQLRWYRAFGVGTRPTKVLHREQLRILRSRPPFESERSSLPPSSVVVECSYGPNAAVLAFGESGFTGFVSWLEAASRA
jgi:hypothetical protein